VRAVRDVAGVQQIEVLNKKGEVATISVDDILAAKLFPLV